MATKTTILLIDDHPLFRESSRRIIADSEAYEVIGEAGDGREGERMAVTLKPDMAVVDLSLPDKSGIQLTSILTHAVPSLKVIIVSMHSKIDYVVSALRAGALGYIVKESVSHCLLKCLDSARKGKYYFDSFLAEEIAQRLMEPPEQANTSDLTHGVLGRREQEVLRLLAQGRTPKEIAEQLFISPKTVENHRFHIRTKLNLRTTADLVHYATKMGLLGNAY